MKESIKELVRAYVLPIAIIGGAFTPLGIVVPHAIRINFTPAAEYHVIETELSPLPNDRFDFLRDRQCVLAQYAISGERTEDQETIKFQRKGQEYFDILKARGYLPSSDAVRILEALYGGRGYNLGVEQGLNRLILAYRTGAAPSPFQEGFTLMEPGSNQSMKELFGKGSLTKLGVMNYYLMDGQGRIVYVATTNAEECSVMRPQQLMFRIWLQGGPWEDLVFAEKQKMVARTLEEIAKNPDRDLLRPAIQ